MGFAVYKNGGFPSSASVRPLLGGRPLPQCMCGMFSEPTTFSLFAFHFSGAGRIQPPFWARPVTLQRRRRCIMVRSLSDTGDLLVPGTSGGATKDPEL